MLGGLWWGSRGGRRGDAFAEEVVDVEAVEVFQAGFQVGSCREVHYAEGEVEGSEGADCRGRDQGRLCLGVGLRLWGGVGRGFRDGGGETGEGGGELRTGRGRYEGEGEEVRWLWSRFWGGLLRSHGGTAR